MANKVLPFSININRGSSSRWQRMPAACQLRSNFPVLQHSRPCTARKPLLFPRLHSLAFRRTLSHQTLLRKHSPCSGDLLICCTVIWSLAKAPTDKYALPPEEKPRDIPRVALESARSLHVNASCYETIQSTFPSYKRK
jgi:hypothetical protein